MVAGTVMAGGNDPRITLDDLFPLAAMAHPDTLAPLDPPNRETFTGGGPRALTYALLVVFNQTDLRSAHVVARRMASALRNKMLIPTAGKSTRRSSWQPSRPMTASTPCSSA
jgi:hypothetical protein